MGVCVSARRRGDDRALRDDGMFFSRRQTMAITSSLITLVSLAVAKFAPGICASDLRTNDLRSHLNIAIFTSWPSEGQILDQVCCTPSLRKTTLVLKMRHPLCRVHFG